jgi:hypothetical protein
MDRQLRVPKRNHHYDGRYFWGVIQIVDEAIIIISTYVLRHTAFSLIHVDRLGRASQLRKRRREPYKNQRLIQEAVEETVVCGARWATETSFLISGRESHLLRRSGREWKHAFR